jgi:hypothetical protein
MNIGINDNTTTQVAAEISDLESRGFDGIIFSWYGKGDQTDEVALKVQQYLNSVNNTNKNFHFIIMVVFGDFVGGESVTNLEANINYCQSQYFSDPHYECEPVTNGNPILMFFNVRSSTYMSESDMETIKAATVPNSLWVDENTGHISEPWLNMTFQWTDEYDSGVNASDPFNLNGITNAFATIKANSSKQAFGAMCSHFNGTLTRSVGWSEGKYLPSSNGLCEVERAADINSVIPANMTRMQWATWSDWEEGTECMSGGENNFALTTQLSNTNVLGWTITSGDERTIDHYDVYAATNGGNAAFLCYVTNGVHQTNVSQLGLTSGSYQLYVNAVAKPCIRDHLSSPVAYVISTAPMITQPPASVTVSYGGTATFSVEVTGVQPLGYMWYDQNTNLMGTNSSLVISSATQSDAYYVNITNQYGSASSALAALTVLSAPGVLANPSNYYSMRITFGGYTNGVGLTNFPVLVRLSTNLPGFSYAHFIAPSNGADLRFTSSNGVEIPFQIDQWNTSGESEVWVQVPAILSTNDFITAYWGNAADSALAACNTNGTPWTIPGGTNNFLLVYHLKESGFPYADATLQSPATNGLAPGVTNGIIGWGGNFTRAPYLDAGTVNLGNAFSLSAWVNVSSGVSDIQCIWANGPGVSGSAEVFFYVNDYKTSDGALILASGNGSTAGNLAAPAGSVSLNQWHLVTASVDRANGQAQLYVDGNQVASGAIRNDFPTNNDMELGRDTGGSFGFLGLARIFHSGINQRSGESVHRLDIT